MSAVPEARKGVFSLTISLGNILSLISMLIAGAFAWAQIQTNHEVLKTRFEMFQEQSRLAQDQQSRRDDMDKKLEALERKIDQRFFEIKRRMQ